MKKSYQKPMFNKFELNGCVELLAGSDGEQGGGNNPGNQDTQDHAKSMFTSFDEEEDWAEEAEF